MRIEVYELSPKPEKILRVSLEADDAPGCKLALRRWHDHRLAEIEDPGLRVEFELGFIRWFYWISDGDHAIESGTTGWINFGDGATELFGDATKEGSLVGVDDDAT